MSKKISIAIDAMGGDNSPNKTIEGIKFFLDKNGKNDDFTLNIFGKEQELTEVFYEKVVVLEGITSPKPFPEFSTDKILATEFMQGLPIDYPSVLKLEQKMLLKNQSIWQNVMISGKKCYEKLIEQEISSKLLNFFCLQNVTEWDIKM